MDSNFVFVIVWVRMLVELDDLIKGVTEDFVEEISYGGVKGNNKELWDKLG